MEYKGLLPENDKRGIVSVSNNMKNKEMSSEVQSSSRCTAAGGKALRRIFVTAASVLLLTGCASTHNNPNDPMEGFNRAMFSFNEGLDKALVKPAAEAYEKVTPPPVRTGVSNFFSNIQDLWIGINNLLQGKPTDAATDFGRFLVNTTVGILGLFDVASEAGMEKHEEDFGQTLGRWGVGDGPYLVLPIIGPRTLRDTAGFVVDTAVDPVWDHKPIATRNILVSLRFLSDRTDLLQIEPALDEAALDKYSYVRSAYLQHRRSLIYDGNPPRVLDDPQSLRLAPEQNARLNVNRLAPLDGVLGLEFAAVGMGPWNLELPSQSAVYAAQEQKDLVALAANVAATETAADDSGVTLDP